MDRLNSRRGFSYLEMTLAALILALCMGVITDTLTLGVQHLRARTEQSQAVVLLDTLFASVRNDLTYATKYYAATGRFEYTVRDNAQNVTYSLLTRYGVGEWPENDPDNYMNPPGWTPAESVETANPAKGVVIRENAIATVKYYEPLVSVRNYSDALSASVRMRYDDVHGEFYVVVQVFNEKNVRLSERNQWIRPIEPIAYVAGN